MWRTWPWPVKIFAIFMAFYILAQPMSAAAQVNRAAGKLQDAGNSLGVFVSHLGK